MRLTCCLLAITAVLTGCGRWWTRTNRNSPPSGALAVGQTAPEIAGQDIDGAPFKLSDYRGKVVVLDFWGHW